MKTQKQILIHCDEKTFDQIKKASEEKKLLVGPFCRMICHQESIKILQEVIPNVA